MRWQHWWAGCALAAATVAASSSASSGEPLDEAAGVLLVCRHGPRAALARAERLRGAADVEAARVLPNPSLVVTHQRGLTGPVDTETVVGVSLPLGIGGRRLILQDAAQSRQTQAAAAARASIFEAVLAFREAYISAVADQARLRAATAQQAELAKLSAMMGGLVKAGEAAGYDLLRQETQAKLHVRLLESLRARAARSRARLIAWTGHEVALPEVPLSSLAVGQQPTDRESPTVFAEPRIVSEDAAARASELEARAARRRWIPDLELFGGYRATDFGGETGHGVALGLTAPLTFFDHGQGEALRAEAEASLARAASSALKREQHALLESATAELNVLQRGIQDAQDLVASAEQVRARAEQLYAAGEASVTELLEAYRGTEEARFSAIALEEEIANARITLMRGRGSLLDSNLDRECAVGPGAKR